MGKKPILGEAVRVAGQDKPYNAEEWEREVMKTMGQARKGEKAK